MHSSYVRSPSVFKDKRLLLIGSSYSAKDLMLQAIKFGADQVTIAHRRPKSEMLFGLPNGVEGRHGTVRFDGKNVVFEDGTVEEVNNISDLLISNQQS